MARRRNALPVPLERDIQKAGVALLKARGWKVFRRNVGGILKLANGQRVRMGEKGQADDYGKTPQGWHFELEFKRPGQRPRVEQRDWLLYMNGSGCDRSVAFWVSSLSDLLQVATRIEQGWRVVYDDPLTSRIAEYHIEPPR